jgi:intein/homing endonuclease
MIIYENGRFRSVRPVDERNRLIQEQLKLLPPKQRAALDILVKEALSKQHDKKSIANMAERLEWDPSTGPAIPIRQWVNDKYMLGELAETFFPKLKEDMVELFEGDYYECVLTGCIDKDALVMCGDGSMPRLGDLIGRKTTVLTINEESGVQLKPSEVGTDSGKRQVLELILTNGMKVRLTPDHRVLTTRGWVRADRLDVTTDRVLRPRRVHYTPSITSLKDDEVKLLAYWTTDGSSSQTRARYCDGNIETGREVLKALRACGFNATTDAPYFKNGAWELHVSNHATSGFRGWLDNHGLLGVGAHSRRVPDAICRAPLEQVALFINRVWAAEGTVYASTKSPPRFQIGMSSEVYIQQLQLLLLRWGIQSRVHDNVAFRNGTECRSWVLQVSGKSDIEKFGAAIGPIFSKESKHQSVMAAVAKTKANTNVDVVPMTWGEANDYLINNGVKRSAGDKWWKLGTARSRYLSRDMFGAFCLSFSNEPAVTLLKQRFPSDVAYERIRAITPMETRISVADIEVPDGERFTANGISVHNSTRWGKDYFGTIALIRVIYELYCLKSPTDTLGLGKGEMIHIIPISHMKEAARRIVFQGVERKLQLSPFWKGRFESTTDEIRFPGKNIIILGGGSNENTAMGFNLWSSLVDEMAFMGKSRKNDIAVGVKEDKSESIYDSLRRRIRGTYAAHGFRGKIFLVSSKKSIHDFTERRLREAMKDQDPGVFVRDYCLAGETRIPLLDGTTPTIKELCDKHGGTEDRFWVYACDTKTKLIVPGRAHHPRLTHKNERVTRIVLDNGQSIRATAWHPFLLRDGTYKRVDALRVGDSLMPLYKLRKAADAVAPNNHKIVAIEDGGVDDVYDLTVEEFGNFATACGVIVSNCTWDVRPNAFPGQKWWNAAVNQHEGRVRILGETGNANTPLHKPDEIHFKFPDEYYKDFLNDPEGAARDIAGIALESFRPFFSNRQAIDDMQKPNRPHPFHVMDWDTGRDIKILWDNLVMRNVHGDPVPRCCPNAFRHCHIDLSKNKDATGFCVGHIAGEMEVSRADPETGERKREEAPFLHIDLVLRIKPPRAGELDHQLVRSLIYKLREGGIPIKSVTADTWMGLPNLQMIEKHGFETDQISTQRTLDPYLAAQSAMYERRIETPVYPHLAKELRELELNDQGTKVDHPKTGSKDCADAFASVIYYLAKNHRSTGGGSVSRGTSEFTQSTPGLPVPLPGGDFRWPDEPPVPKPGDENDEFSSYIIT